MDAPTPRNESPEQEVVALEAFLDQHEKELRAWAQQSQQEDDYQQVLVAVLKQLHRYPRVQDLLGVFYRGIPNKGKDRRRADARRDKREKAVARCENEAPEHGADYAIRNELIAALRAYVKSLPLKKQAIVRERYWAGKTLDEVAASTGSTKAAVKSTLLRALRQLKADLSECYSPEDVGDVSRRTILFGAVGAVLTFGGVGTAAAFSAYNDLEAFNLLTGKVRHLREVSADIVRCRLLLEPVAQAWTQKLQERPDGEIARFVIEAADLCASLAENNLNPDGERWLTVMEKTIPHLGHVRSAWQLRYLQQRARFAFLRGNPHLARAILKKISGEDPDAFFSKQQIQPALDHDMRARGWSFQSSVGLQMANHLVSTGLPEDAEKWLGALLRYLRSEGNSCDLAWREAVWLTCQAEWQPEKARDHASRILDLNRRTPVFKLSGLEHSKLLLRSYLAGGQDEVALDVVEKLPVEAVRLGFHEAVLGLVDAAQRAQGALRSKLVTRIASKFGRPVPSVLSAAWPA